MQQIYEEIISINPSRTISSDSSSNSDEEQNESEVKIIQDADGNPRGRRRKAKTAQIKCNICGLDHVTEDCFGYKEWMALNKQNGDIISNKKDVEYAVHLTTIQEYIILKNKSLIIAWVLGIILNKDNYLNFLYSCNSCLKIFFIKESST